jgi:hypothetical protein
MRISARWIVAGLFWISTCVGAQVATYDVIASLLTLPAVKVGSDTYTNVTLLNIGNFTFKLKTATQQLPPGPATVNYDGTTNVLTIPVVQLGSASYINVTLQNIGSYTFTLGTATFSSAEGSWKGTTTDGRKTFGAILDDGSFYFLYLAAGGRNAPGGFIVGNGASLNGSFSSASLVDFNVEGAGVLSGAMAANYVNRQSLNGTITNAGNAFSITFTDAFDPNWYTVPTLAALAGTYAGQALIAAPPAEENLNVTISLSGGISSTDAFGCTRTGQATPRGRGNLYDISFTEGAGCPFAGQTFTGIGGLDETKTQLIALLTNSGRTTAEVFVGDKM